MSTITLKVPAVNAILRQSRATLEAVARGDVDALLAVGNVFRTFMLEELRQPGTGRVYTTQWRVIRGRPTPINKPRPGGPHQASAPGQPPTTDTGVLKNNLAVAITVADARVTKVGIGVAAVGFYWRLLEYGTKWMEPRPFVRPAHLAGRRGALETLIKKMRARTRQLLAQRRTARS